MIEQIQNSPEKIQFSEVIAYIDQNFDFESTKFKNGELINEKNENNGSCKIISFAKLNKLNQEETLALFGDFYRIDVLQNPEGEDHQNIRNFMKFGWDGIEFENEALITK